MPDTPEGHHFAVVAEQYERLIARLGGAVKITPQVNASVEIAALHDRVSALESAPVPIPDAAPEPAADSGLADLAERVAKLEAAPSGTIALDEMIRQVALFEESGRCLVERVESSSLSILDSIAALESTAHEPVIIPVAEHETRLTAVESEIIPPLQASLSEARDMGDDHEARLADLEADNALVKQGSPQDQMLVIQTDVEGLREKMKKLEGWVNRPWWAFWWRPEI